MISRRPMLWFACAVLMPPAIGMANPLQPQVVGGSATVSGVGTSNTTVTQSSDRAIINWNTFNIGAGETTRFQQPGASSVTLNRVTGGLGASDISGNLIANGRVFLVNPDGILFGAGAKIDTAGFLATTNDIKNQDFMEGRYIFNIPGRPDASIVNLGTITATAENGGFAALVAPGVRNAGTITATLGKIGLAAGNGFTLDLYGDRLITLAVGDEIAGSVRDVATGQPLNALVKNEGTLRANGGRVQLTAAAARQVVDSVINNSGVIEANSIGRRNGMIVLGAATRSSKPAQAPTQKVKVAGKMSASGKNKGETGGAVEITGEDIVVSAADIDVTGSAGGGKVLIGGDWGGGKPDTSLVANASAALESYAVPTATNVTVGNATTINASALDEGNGGKVVVWSDGTTAFAGSILARGGALSGTGGFVEVSGRQLLNFNGMADLRAPAGAWGTLLTDQEDVTISDSGTFSVASFLNQLALGNLIIKTEGGEGTGDIIVAQGVTWDTATALTLSAYRNINVNANLANTGGADVTLRADGTGSGVGTVNFGAGVQISTSGKVSIFYNPTTQDSGPKYADVAEDFSANVTGGAKLTAYMLVNTVDDLQNVSNNLSGVYALGKDIEARATAQWNEGAGFAPIGNGQSPFAGLFDGQGRTISDLTINSFVSEVGLFGALGPGGLIRNVGLAGGTVRGGSEAYVGALVGLNLGTVSGASATTAVTGGDFSAVGGLVGFQDLGGSVLYASAFGPISAGALSSAGGLVGTNWGTITRAYAEGSVTGGADSAVGGLVGFQGPSGAVIQSYATGAVDAGASSRAGGLIGQNWGAITQSYAQGFVIGQADSGIGGLVGENRGAITQSFALGAVSGGLNSYVGGLVGINGGRLFQTYAVGAVRGTGALALGGLVANNQGTVDNSYWDILTTGQATSAGGTGLTTAQLTATLAAGFDGSVWTINPDVNGGYPCLLWTCSPPVPTSPDSPTVPVLPPGSATFVVLPGPAGPTPPVVDIPPFPPTSGPLTIGVPLVTVSLDNPQTTGNPDGTQPGTDSPDGTAVANVNTGQPGATSPGSTSTANTQNATQPDANTPTGSTGNTPTSATQPGGSGPPASGAPPPGENRFVRNEVLLHFQDGVSQEEIERILRRLRLVVLAAQRLDIIGRTMYRLRIPDRRSVGAVIRALEGTGLSIGVQPNYVYRLNQSDPASQQADPAGRSRVGELDQYAFKKLGLDEVHRLVRGDNVLVALIDSEVDLGHPDLKGAIAGRYDAGCGADAVPHPHGTGMAGAIVSHGTVTGVAPAARLLTICAFGGAAANPQATTLNILKGLDWAIDHGARIVNMSFAGPRDPVLAQALKILREKNIVLVGAAGNGGPKSRPLYPGADPNVIAVTATDLADRLFPRANRGSYIAVAAPGVDILVPSPDGDYQLTTGTSVAAAHVSGIAALIFARRPGVTANDVQAMLSSTATDLGPKGFDDQYGWGLVNPLRALNWVDPKSQAKDATSSLPDNR